MVIVVENEHSDTSSNSLLQKFGNGLPYCLTFTTKISMRWFPSVCQTIWKQRIRKDWWVKWRYWKCGSSETLVVLNFRICYWDPGHDWNRSQQVDQVKSPEHGSVWVSSQAACVDRHSLFLISENKGQIFSQPIRDKRKDYDEKLLNKFKHPLQMNMLWFFTGEKQNQILNSKYNSWLALSSTKCTDRDEKTNT